MISVFINCLYRLRLDKSNVVEYSKESDEYRCIIYTFVNVNIMHDAYHE